MEKFAYKIPDYDKRLNVKPPERLVGRTIIAILNKGELRFAIDMPPNPTNQELGFVKWLAMEVGDLAGLDLQTMECRKMS